MSETPAAPNASVATPPRPFSWIQLLVTVVPYVALYAVAIWLVAMTDSDPARTSTLWEWFVPTVGLIGIIGGWHRMQSSGGSIPQYLFKQILHWGATLGVIYLLSSHAVLDFLTADTHGFVAIYVVGLADILAGVHLDWKMGLFGLFLIGSGIGIAFFDDNAMLMTLTGLAVIGVIVSVVVLRLRKG